MSADCSTGYPRNPIVARSFSFNCSCWSLYVGTRSSQLSGVIISSSEFSTKCAGTSLCRKIVLFFGSSPPPESPAPPRARSSCSCVCVGVVGGQRVVVRDEVEALILRAAVLQHLVLQLHPVLQRAHVVAQVQPPGRTHAAQYALARRMICLFAHFLLNGKGTGFCRRLTSPSTAGRTRPAAGNRTSAMNRPPNRKITSRPHIPIRLYTCSTP